MRRYCLFLCLLSMYFSHAQEGFPQLGIDNADRTLNRATNLDISLSESLELFARSVQTNDDPRAILCYTRTLLIALTAFRSNLMMRYADYEHAPVEPKITEAEAQQLRAFIYRLMQIQAELLAFEETVLQRVEQQYPQLAQNGAIRDWKSYIQRGRERLARRSEVTGLAIDKFPTVRWEDRYRLVSRLQETLRECEWKPAGKSRRERVELPASLKRFVEAPLPWVIEE